jgi:hypothetical protein
MAFKSILDPTFKYCPANRTNVRLTFDRIRREQLERKPETEHVVVSSKVIGRRPAEDRAYEDA